MSQEDIDASEAPLMDHLLELRSRLMKCVLGFAIAFIASFFFSSKSFFVWSGANISLIFAVMPSKSLRPSAIDSLKAPAISI